MATAIVTGSAGLIGSETVRFLHDKGMDVIGLDNNLREYFFGSDGTTHWMAEKLASSLPSLQAHGYRHSRSGWRFQAFPARIRYRACGALRCTTEP
jgi:NAD(P)-dependent dehydrogenase (short-subunit alcohol dehydrogenase family)